MGSYFLIRLASPISITQNLSSWHRAVATLCNKGEAIITSEWTYPSALFAMIPYAVTVAPVAMDSQGMRADNLRRVLQNWDETARGAPR
jgi:aromatic amino acid aminotransferase I / 2-aminoadipate transaminase